MELDPFLGAYNYEQHPIWKEATLYLTEPLLAKLAPTNTQIVASTIVENISEESRVEADQMKIEMLASTEVQEKPDEQTDNQQPMNPEEPPKKRTPAAQQQKHKAAAQATTPFTAAQHTLNLTLLPTKYFDPTATGSALTKSVLDKTALLRKVLTDNHQMPANHLLGELQLCFILFLVGEDFDAFEQFKRLVDIFCHAEEFCYEQPNFVSRLVRRLWSHSGCLYSVVVQFPKDFFYDVLSKNNFMQECLQSLIEIVDDPRMPQFVKTRAAELENMLQNKFQMKTRPVDIHDGELDFDEDDEFAPVVVENPGKFINFDQD